MRYAIVSDIHANLQAWEAVMADMASLPDLTVDRVICLGDIVGYGPDPSPVLRAVRKHSSVTVVGNHDAAACDRMDASLFNDNAREAIDWTRGQLSEEDLEYLKQLPEKVRLDGADFLAVHAEMVAPMNFGYILSEEDAKVNFEACKDRITFIGHSHRAGIFMQQPSGEVSIHDPMDFSCDPSNRYIINPGSVGDPRSTEIVASYVIYDDATDSVYFRRIPFDIESYRRSIDVTPLETRPFFLRYLDAIASGGTAEAEVIPSVAETDGVPQINLAIPTFEPKKKDPVVKVGIWVLLIALAAGVWFFVTNTKTGTAVAQEESPERQRQKRVSDRKVQSKAARKPKGKITDKLPIKARYVRISLPREGVLCLAEVEVYSGNTNVALKGKATQSSNFDKLGIASNAIDGDMSARYTDGHMTHTKEGHGNWWMVDLGKEYPIKQVVLWNRNEGPTPQRRKKLQARLNGYTLEMMDGKNKLVFQRKGNPGMLLRNLVK